MVDISQGVGEEDDLVDVEDHKEDVLVMLLAEDVEEISVVTGDRVLVDHQIPNRAMSVGCVANLPMNVPNRRHHMEVIPPIVGTNPDPCIEARVVIGVEGDALALAG